MRRPAVALAFVLGGANALAQDADTGKENKLSNYLVDIQAGAVSAAGIIGLQESAVSEVQSSQDLVLALKPFSSNASKAGFGVAISPFRTSILPMSGQDYANPSKPWNRALGALTLSYAENSATLSSVAYRKNAFSLDTSYYLDRDDDPAIKANRAFAACEAREQAEDRAMNATTDEERKKAQEEAAAAAKECIDTDAAKKKAAWNAGRIMASYGRGWIQPDETAGPKLSLGKWLIFGAVLRSGRNGATHITHKRASEEVDLTSLQATPAFKDSSLTAIRYTYGAEGNGDLRWLAEVSDAKTSQVTQLNGAFKRALGLDKKLFDGVWLQFRVGKSRTADGTTEQTSSLLTVNWMPSAGLFEK